MAMKVVVMLIVPTATRRSGIMWMMIPFSLEVTVCGCKCRRRRHLHVRTISCFVAAYPSTIAPCVDLLPRPHTLISIKAPCTHWPESIVFVFSIKLHTSIFIKNIIPTIVINVVVRSVCKSEILSFLSFLSAVTPWVILHSCQMPYYSTLLIILTCIP